MGTEGTLGQRRPVAKEEAMIKGWKIDPHMSGPKGKAHLIRSISLTSHPYYALCGHRMEQLDEIEGWPRCMNCSRIARRHEQVTNIKNWG